MDKQLLCMVFIILLFAGCVENPTTTTTTESYACDCVKAGDCESCDKDKPACVGYWDCIDGGCVWMCETVSTTTTESGKIGMKEAFIIAGNSNCVEEGELTDKYMYNEYTRTWWIDLDIEKEGCNPACVVSEETRTAEINWRCTGLIPE